MPSIPPTKSTPCTATVFPPSGFRVQPITAEGATPARESSIWAWPGFWLSKSVNRSPTSSSKPLLVVSPAPKFVTQPVVAMPAKPPAQLPVAAGAVCWAAVTVRFAARASLTA